MNIVERIQPDGEEKLDVHPLTVSDVEIFRIDIVRYLNLQRRKKNMKVLLQIKET